MGDTAGVLLVLLEGTEILLGLLLLLIEPAALLLLLLLLAVVENVGLTDELREVLVFLEVVLEVVGFLIVEETFD